MICGRDVSNKRGRCFRFSEGFAGGKRLLGPPKINVEKDTMSTQKEKTNIDRERHRRLMNDFEKDDRERLEAMYKSFQSMFRLTRNELDEHILNFDGTLEEFYYHMKCLAK